MYPRIASIVAVLAAGLTTTIAAATGPGQPAPAVQLLAEDGSTTRIADHRGHVVLVDFWASWCAPCKASFPALDALYTADRPRGLDVLAVNLDERRSDADAFLRARAHSMPVFFDATGASASAFGVKGMPSSVVIDRAGIVRFVHMGYSTKTLAKYRNEIESLLSEKQP
jgi:cytochrome c biogenesis protein CcmG/thiol:disulfide interchange protein DsbE